MSDDINEAIRVSQDYHDMRALQASLVPVANVPSRHNLSCLASTTLKTVC